MEIIDTLIPDNPLFAKNVIPYGAKASKTFVLTGLSGNSGSIAVDDTLSRTGGDEECVVIARDAASPTWIVVRQTSDDVLIAGTYTGPSGSTTVATLYERPITGKVEMRARLYVETAQDSGAYEYITELKNFPDDTAWAFFHWHGILDDDPLEYGSIEFSQSNYLDQKVCRKIKVEFYMYDPDENALHAEGYHEDSSIPLIEIPELTDDIKYKLVIKTDDPDLVDQVYICNDDDSSRVNHTTAGYVNDIQGDETHKLIGTSSGSIHKYLHIPPKVKVEIYEYPNNPTSGLIEPTYTVPAVRFAIKGGFDVISLIWGSEEYLGTPDGQFLNTPDGQKILFI